jgi:hypothetical protein
MLDKQLLLSCLSFDTHFTSTSRIDRSVALRIPFATLEVSVLLVLHFFILLGLLLLAFVFLLLVAQQSLSSNSIVLVFNPVSTLPTYAYYRSNSTVLVLVFKPTSTFRSMLTTFRQLSSKPSRYMNDPSTN